MIAPTLQPPNSSGCVPIAATTVAEDGSIRSQSVCQANIIAGADNVAGNGIQIVVMPRSLVPGMTTTGELIPLTSTADMSFDDGDQLQFRVANNEIGIVMTGNNGLDSTMQSVGGDMGQILQQTILNSNNNNVLNSASLVFGISDSLQDTGRINADGALLAMKGFGY